MAIPVIAVPPAQFKFSDTGAIQNIDGDAIPDGTVTITHAKTGKIMAVVEYEDTDGNGFFSGDVGPGGIVILDQVLSITNPGNVKFVDPCGSVG